MDIQLDLRQRKPFAEQLVESVERAIREQRLLPGEQLPTVRQLGAQLRINFNTVARAYRLLEQKGLLFTQQGRGTYVADVSRTGNEQETYSIETAIAQMKDCLEDAAVKLNRSPEQMLLEFLLSNQVSPAFPAHEKALVRRNNRKKRSTQRSLYGHLLSTKKPS